LASVKSGKSKAKASRRRKSAPGRRLRRWTLALAAVAVSGVVVAAAGGFGLRSFASAAIGDMARSAVDAGFRNIGLTVQDVTVSGRRNAPAAEILAALLVERGASMMTFNTEDARARVLDVDWVEDAQVKRLFPNTIRVTVKERTPFAVWQKSDHSYVVDIKGKTIAQASASVMAQLPFLAGVGAPEAAPKLLAMLEERPSIKSRLRVASRIGDRRWTLKLDGGVDVMLPASGAGPALDELLRLEDTTGILGRDIQVIDLRIPDRLTLRARSVKKPKDERDENS